MKELDRVKLIKDRAEYAQEGTYKGDVGTIMMGERNVSWFFLTVNIMKITDIR